MSNEKKSNPFVRIRRGIAKWFRELRSELKKVVWPTWKQLVNNTGVVIATVAFVGVIISLFGLAAETGVSALIGLTH